VLGEYSASREEVEAALAVIHAGLGPLPLLQLESGAPQSVLWDGAEDASNNCGCDRSEEEAFVVCAARSSSCAQAVVAGVRCAVCLSCWVRREVTDMCGCNCTEYMACVVCAACSSSVLWR
jgi:hypothetical protein